MNSKGWEKSRRGKKRADEIVKLFCRIARTKENRRVKEYLERSNIYQEIQNGNEVFLYDSLAANLLEITNELRKDYGDCLGSQYITVGSISSYYKKQLGEEVSLREVLKQLRKTRVYLAPRKRKRDVAEKKRTKEVVKA